MVHPFLEKFEDMHHSADPCGKQQQDLHFSAIAHGVDMQ
jgi:hypothetical protein